MQLGAVDDQNTLTPIGHELSRLPLDPRVGRMILAARERQSLSEVLVIASALSVQDVRDRPLEQQQAADQAHKKFDDEKSEFIGDLKLWKWLEDARGGAKEHKLSHRKQEQLLQKMFSKFALFNDLIRNVELAMSKADLAIAKLYASLVRDEGVRERVWRIISEEFERTRRMLLVVKQQEKLLEKNPVLSRSIRLRNPYVDPMSLIQVDLLRRKQSGDDSEQLNYALAATINGIAAGLHNTG